MLQMLLAAGAQVAARRADNCFTPLHEACRAGNVEAVRVLLASERGKRVGSSKQGCARCLRYLIVV